MENHLKCLDEINNGAIAKPDGDIAGLGVIIAFTFSACSTHDLWVTWHI